MGFKGILIPKLCKHTILLNCQDNDFYHLTVLHNTEIKEPRTQVDADHNYQAVWARTWWCFHPVDLSPIEENTSDDDCGEDRSNREGDGENHINPLNSCISISTR
jgi:hypothetical protein